MSSFTKYRVEVNGPKSDLARFAALIEAAAYGEAQDGDIPIPFASVFPDWHEAEHYRAFWITPINTENRPLFRISGDQLSFEGESRNTPPVRFLLRVSEMFPELAFHITSVTEHTMVETWHVTHGGAKLIEACLDPIREPCIWYVKDGVALGPLPDWIEQHYPLYE